MLLVSFDTTFYERVKWGIQLLCVITLREQIQSQRIMNDFVFRPKVNGQNLKFLASNPKITLSFLYLSQYDTL